MKRRTDTELVERFRRREVEAEANLLRTRITQWCEDNLDALAESRPEIPTELGDRAADCWEPLIAIADLTGGTWPERARDAAVRLSTVPDDTAMSPGVRLLDAIRSAFQSQGHSQIGSAVLARAVSDSESWPSREPIDARELAARLRVYDVQPRLLRRGNDVYRGYRQADFADAFSRYLQPSP